MFGEPSENAKFILKQEHYITFVLLSTNHAWSVVSRHSIYEHSMCPTLSLANIFPLLFSLLFFSESFIKVFVVLSVKILKATF